MMKTEKKKNILLEEQLRKIKYRVDYKINESPKYRPLVNSNEEFDAVPLTNEAGDQEDAPLAQEKEPVEPTTDVPAGVDDAPVPAFAQGEEGNEVGVDVPPEGDAPVPPVEPNPEQGVDTIQNDIIKHNIEAMKSIHTQLEDLNSIVQGLNNKLETLNADVEEVREPTNSEKLMSKKNVSYPFYFNLNDFWDGNWFDAKREVEGDNGGIRELPDGSFVADFDDLPQRSKVDIQNSFGEIYESAGKKKVQLKEEIEITPSNSGGQSEIDGLSKQTAIRRIYSKILPLTQGFFRDEAWENVQKVFKVFNDMNLDWNITKTEYDHKNVPPHYKIWYFEINLIGNQGRPKKIMGNLTAAGAGSVEYPLDKYDISVVLS